MSLSLKTPLSAAPVSNLALLSVTHRVAGGSVVTTATYVACDASERPLPGSRPQVVVLKPADILVGAKASQALASMRGGLYAALQSALGLAGDVAAPAAPKPRVLPSRAVGRTAAQRVALSKAPAPAAKK